MTYFSLSHDEAKLINGNLVRDTPATAAVVTVHLGDVVQREDAVLTVATGNPSPLSGHLLVLVQWITESNLPLLRAGSCM